MGNRSMHDVTRHDHVHHVLMSLKITGEFNVLQATVNPASIEILANV